MQDRNHSPAYVAELGRSWRVVIPIRGRLAPRLWPEEFATQIEAIAWLQSEEGIEAIALQRSRRSSPYRHAKGFNSAEACVPS